MPPWIAGWATCGSGAPSRPGAAAMSPIANTSGWPGSERSGSTTRRPPRPVGVPSVAGQRLGRHAGGPHDRAGRRCIVPSVEVDPRRPRPRHADAEADLDAAALAACAGPVRDDCRLNGVSSRSASSTSDDARVARRAGAGSPWPAPCRTARAARRPSRRRSARRRTRRRRARRRRRATDRRRPRSKRSSTWARRASASSRCLSGNVCSPTPGDAEVVGHGARWRRRGRRSATSVAVVERRRVRSREVDAGDPRHADRRRSPGARAGGRDDAADGVGDVVAVEPGGRHLVQQRLERVEVVGVDERHVDGRRRAGRAPTASPPKPPPTITTWSLRPAGGGDSLSHPHVGSPAWPSSESTTRRSRSTASASSSWPRTTSTSSRRASPSGSTSAARRSAR